MQRKGDITNITMEGRRGYAVKETPEEILAMPDIEESNKVIDWEQRRYEIAKDVAAGLVSRPNKTYDSVVNFAIKTADKLIERLKEK